jgi:hypothetical protein
MLPSSGLSPIERIVSLEHRHLGQKSTGAFTFTNSFLQSYSARRKVTVAKAWDEKPSQTRGLVSNGSTPPSFIIDNNMFRQLFVTIIAKVS